MGEIKFVDLKYQYQILQSRIDKAIQKVLDHGQYIQGPEVFELEVKLATYSGAKYCVSCSSGTDALLMSLLASMYLSVPVQLLQKIFQILQ